jgi:hypothetical protein
MSRSILRSAEAASINDRQRATLEPGDLICTGTPHRVGHGQTSLRYLKIKDLMTLSIEGLGERRQLVAAAGSHRRDHDFAHLLVASHLVSSRLEETLDDAI